jgi:F5/8 type C domain-containing protein
MVSVTSAPVFLKQAIRWVRAERTLPEYTPSQRTVVARCATAADQRVRCAQDAALYPMVAAGLLRDAVAFLTRAASIGREGHASVDTVAALGELRAASARVLEDEDVRRIADALEASDPLYFDAMDATELEATLAALEQEARWLRPQIDLRSPTYRAGARVGRTAGVALCAVWLLYLLLGVLFPPKDLALNKPVRASSHQPGAPDPSGLVDGKIAPTFGFHTDVTQRDAWAIVDLERPGPIRKIVVSNRSDHDSDDTLPYWLDVSTDGVTFHEVATRAEHFGDGAFASPAWTVTLREHGRYVRIRSRRYLALNELAVY